MRTVMQLLDTSDLAHRNKRNEHVVAYEELSGKPRETMPPTAS
jgi:hypothetical protein